MIEILVIEDCQTLALDWEKLNKEKSNDCNEGHRQKPRGTRAFSDDPQLKTAVYYWPDSIFSVHDKSVKTC